MADVGQRQIGDPMILEDHKPPHDDDEGYEVIIDGGGSNTGASVPTTMIMMVWFMVNQKEQMPSMTK